MFTRTHIKATTLALTVAGALIAATAAAKDVTVALHVSAQGLDLSQPADVRTLYSRLENAAWVACTRGNRADLLPVENQTRCYEDSLAGAIRAARQPMLTQIYLSDHTLQQAAAHGIDVSVVAAK